MVLHTHPSFLLVKSFQRQRKQTNLRASYENFQHAMNSSQLQLYLNSQ
jgi:hypothetical protein